LLVGIYLPLGYICAALFINKADHSLFINKTLFYIKNLFT